MTQLLPCFEQVTFFIVLFVFIINDVLVFGGFLKFKAEISLDVSLSNFKRLERLLFLQDRANS